MACPHRGWVSLVGALAFLGAISSPGSAQKSGGVLKLYNSSNPPSASLHEESTIASAMPFMAIYNNLVMFDPTKEKNSLETVIPDLADSWSWDETKTKLTFKLHPGVTWHDGHPFTAKDVQCTWHRLIGREPNFFRRVPRGIWWENLKEVTINGDTEVTFHLGMPQVSLLPMLAAGYSPVYPCHVAAKDMRTNPIGTGPFKLVEFKGNQSIKLVRNAAYWKPGRPYLDGIQWQIIPNRATRVLAFSAGEFDMTFTSDITAPLRKDILGLNAETICKTVEINAPTSLLINAKRPPFDDVRVRRAVSLAIDRQAVIDIVSHGESTVGGNMMSTSTWAMPKDALAKLDGYGPPATQQPEARRLMESLGYGPSKRLKVKLSTREFGGYKDPAVVLVDQLNKAYFEAELETIETTVWFNRLGRQDFTLAMNINGSGIDDPDAVFRTTYNCKSEANYTKYCNPDVEKLIDLQSAEFDADKRRAIVWQIESALASDVARPIVMQNTGATCWHPVVRGFVLQSSSIYNDWRFEQVWLDK